MRKSVKIAIGGGVTFIFGIIFGWIAFPALLKHQISAQVALKDGGEIRSLFLKVPFPLDFKVYIFNVTNPLDVQKGEPPVLIEIGPFFYDEWKEKINVKDNETDDTMTYNPKNTFIFNQKKSGKLTGDEIVTIPHPIFLSIVLSVASTKPGMLSLVNKAIISIFNNPESVFVTATVKELLFEGILINCTVTDFAGKAVCAVLKTEAENLDVVAENVYKFSFFGSKNATINPPFKVKRGIKNVRDLGRVVEFNGQKELDIWATKKCNQFGGTDSTIFPPFLTNEEGLLAFSPELCRSLLAVYEKSLLYKRIPVNRYTATFGDMSKNKEDKCYCPTPDTCLKRGVIDVSKCVGAPIIASLPHFFEADSSYVEDVRGLYPREDDHGIYIIFEPISGTPLEAKKRLQFNMPFIKIEKVALMKNLAECLMPIFWIEEGVELNATYVKQLDSQLFRTLRIMGVVKWLILVISTIVTGAGIFMYYKQNSGFSVTPISNGNTHQLQPQKSHIISTVSGANGTEQKY